MISGNQSASMEFHWYVVIIKLFCLDLNINSLDLSIFKHNLFAFSQSDVSSAKWLAVDLFKESRSGSLKRWSSTLKIDDFSQNVEMFEYIFISC